MGNILGNNRKIAISREITKKYEEIYRGTIEELVKQNNGDFQQTFLKLARERNIDPNQFFNFLKRNNLK